MVKVIDITQHLEKAAPLSLQEDYDNAGLILGQATQSVSCVLITLDVTEAIIDEAISLGAELIIAHHPLIFKGLKKINGDNPTERALIKAIKNDIAIYAAHTNLDNVAWGVNNKICDKLGLTNRNILSPKSEQLNKLTSFVPIENTEFVLDALHTAGAGNIGNYQQCSFKISGTGSFMPNENARPHIGEQNRKEEVTENRIEVIFPAYLQKKVLAALHKAHPYEEVAYYLHKLENKHQEVGSGMIGILPEPMSETNFLQYLKQKMDLTMLRHTAFTQKNISKIAVCGGSGSFLLAAAKNQKADVFVSADFKYHEFFDAAGEILIADIGHYESERFTKELFYEILSEKFSNIALHLSNVNTNPIHYA